MNELKFPDNLVEAGTMGLCIFGCEPGCSTCEDGCSDSCPTGCSDSCIQGCSSECA